MIVFCVFFVSLALARYPSPPLTPLTSIMGDYGAEVLTALKAIQRSQLNELLRDMSDNENSEKRVQKALKTTLRQIKPSVLDGLREERRHLLHAFGLSKGSNKVQVDVNEGELVLAPRGQSMFERGTKRPDIIFSHPNYDAQCVSSS